ncbi:hypothetical protein IT412_04160 [Candidatus Peregrinibacteria bacterium]|nr:hypothetical protein [Candidatus Peregrinibacteria bacterium]
MDDKEMEFFKANVAEAIKYLREGLTNIGWKPCVDENGKADKSFRFAVQNEDMVGKSVVVFRPCVREIIAPKPKAGEWSKSYGYDLLVVKITSIKLDDFDNSDDKLKFLQWPEFEWEGKTHMVYPYLDMYDGDSLENWHLLAFERTNTKLHVIIHMCGRASAPATPRKTMRI